MGLRLLLNSVQNSIEEPWQRIPSVISLFAAEASCVLLDPTNDHYAAISTFLIHSSKLNMRVRHKLLSFFLYMKIFALLLVLGSICFNFVGYPYV